MYLEAPWTQIGALQQEISSIKSELSRKAEGYEIHSINIRLDSMEHTLWEIGSALDGLISRLQATEDKINQSIQM